MISPRILIISIVLLSALVSIAEFVLSSQGVFLTEQTQVIWALLFCFMTIWWVWGDAEEKSIARHLDFGFHLYIFLPLALPAYLIKTRGMSGLFWVAGFFALWLAPFLFSFVGYVFFYE